jgi:hypothetical protein
MIADESVELVFFTGCPHALAARANLEVAFQKLGRTPRWREWDLEDPGLPSRITGYPSPTVLVAGRDVNGARPDAASSGLACAAEGAPSVGRIMDALLDQ